MGLFKPAMIRVGRDGSVWVADNDDAKVHVFDSTGVALGEIGGRSHLSFIVDFALLDSSVVILDSTRRLIRLSRSGELLPIRQPMGYEQAIASVGRNQVILASSAQWTGRVPQGRVGWPLARVMTEAGDSLYEIGRRPAQANRYAAHIDNFVLPSGGGDGHVVWLAYLNSPAVVAYSPGDSKIRRTERPIPFEWQRMPASFVPKGQRRKPPFDAISYSIASDTMGRAYVLTALGARDTHNEPTAMAVDVLDAQPARPLQRWTFSGTATHLAVSTDGARIYLLDTHRNKVRVFRGTD